MSVLVAIEGIDGAGKGTQAKRLAEQLKELGYKVGSLGFPRYSQTRFGAAIGDFLNGRFGDLQQVHPQLAAALYAGDRFESLRLLTRLRSENDCVVLDRYTGSSLAHQAARLQGDAQQQLTDWIEQIEYEVYGLPRADLTILLDISSAWSSELVHRKDARDYTDAAADIQEADQSYLARVRSAYRRIADERNDWTTVSCLGEDGSLRAVEDIGAEVLRIVTPLLPRQVP